MSREIAVNYGGVMRERGRERKANWVKLSHMCFTTPNIHIQPITNEWKPEIFISFPSVVRLNEYGAYTPPPAKPLILKTMSRARAERGQAAVAIEAERAACGLLMEPEISLICKAQRILGYRVN